MWTQAKDCRQPQEAGRSKKEYTPGSLQEAGLCRHVDLDPLILISDFRPRDL